jgi:hypothetical protein
VGLFEESFTGIHQLFEDQVFLSKVYIKAPVFVAGERWFKYRQHSGSCVSIVAQAGKKHTAGLFFFDWLERYLASQGMQDAEVWHALNSKRWRYRHPLLDRLAIRARYWAGVLSGSCKSGVSMVLPVSIRGWMRAHLHNHRSLRLAG